jgi:3-dehydroquinate synthetase
VNNAGEVRRVVETLLLRLRDSSVAVKTAARDAVKELMGLVQNPQAIINRLSFNYQTLYRDEILDSTATAEKTPMQPAILNLGQNFQPDLV